MKLEKINLKNLADSNLQDREMNALVGGSAGNTSCGCGCCYENNKGSSTDANFNANQESSYHSEGMHRADASYSEYTGEWTYYEDGTGPWTGGC